MIITQPLYKKIQLSNKNVAPHINEGQLFYTRRFIIGVIDHTPAPWLLWLSGQTLHLLTWHRPRQPHLQLHSKQNQVTIA